MLVSCALSGTKLSDVSGACDKSKSSFSTVGICFSEWWCLRMVVFENSSTLEKKNYYVRVILHGDFSRETRE